MISIEDLYNNEETNEINKNKIYNIRVLYIMKIK